MKACSVSVAALLRTVNVPSWSNTSSVAHPDKLSLSRTARSRRIKSFISSANKQNLPLGRPPSAALEHFVRVDPKPGGSDLAKRCKYAVYHVSG